MATQNDIREWANHALCVAGSKQARELDGVLVYVSSVKRMRHAKKEWGWYNLAVYRGILEGFERTMPLGKFMKLSKPTGHTVEYYCR